MVVREMIAEDITELAILYKQFWNETACVETMLRQFNRLKDNESYLFLSAIEDNKLVGSVMGIICEELYGNCEPFLVLENMIVDKTVRNKGIGKRLIIKLEEIAVKRNCTQVLLVTETSRTDACEFYKAMGYNPQTHKGFKKKLK